MTDEPTACGTGEARQRPTIQEIAQRVGVNKSTVSRVLSGTAAGSASTATADQIQRVATELGYRPDPWAASLRTQQTRTIGVLLPHVTDVVLAMIFEALDATASSCGYEVLVASTGDSAAEQRRRIELLHHRRVDGLIITTGHRGDTAYFDELAAQGIRFVLANRAVGAHPVIRADDRDGGRQATRHLLELGHHRIGVVAGPAYATTAVDRVHGYRDAMAEHGLAMSPELVVESRIDITGGETATRQLLTLDRPPTAIFAINDFAALGVLGTLREAGYTVGTDIAVVGYNDIPVASRLPVPLTSVAHPVTDIGQRAVHALLQLLDGHRPRSQTLPVQLTIRDTSQPVL